MAIAILATFGTAGAQMVVPAAKVKFGVAVRAAPAERAPRITVLKRGRSLPVRQDLIYWYEVRLPNGSAGFVSKGLVEIRDEE